MKRINTVLILLITIISIQCTTTKKTLTLSEPELQRVPFTSSVDQKERDFFLYLPKGYHSSKEKEWPILMFLHGNGERGDGKDDLDYTMIHGPLYEAWVQKRDLPFIMIVPQLPMFGRDTMGLGYIDNRTKAMVPKRQEVGTPTHSKSYQPNQSMTGALSSHEFPNGIITLPMGWEQVENDLIMMIDQIKSTYSVNENRIYLSGLSYGGFGTWYMASKHPDLFAAINPIVGWGHPSLMPPIAEAKIPVWAFAGGRDPVIEAKYFYPGINKLEELGHTNIRLTVEEDMGHDVWIRVYEGQDIYDWLLSHSK